jgi:C1A family cysteine protease
MSRIIVALALLFGSTAATTYTSSPTSQKYLWEQFKTEHSRTYATMKEEESRFTTFISTLKLIDARNAKEKAAGGTAVHGITKFADLTQEEFAAHYLNYSPSDSAGMNATKATGLVPLDPKVGAAQDWTGTYTTPVKDQGYCGSCWAFSVTEQVESDWLRSGGDEKILSPQQVTSCTQYILPGVGGCNGGKPETGYTYAQGGLELEVDYPYTSGKAGVTGTCSADSSKFVVKTTSYTNVASSAAEESVMGSYVAGTGPLSIVVDASEWSTYTGGILSSCGTSLDHAVQAVGIDTDEGSWKVRNSWGTSWGESGFIRLSYGSNTCAIASDANYAGAATY